MFVQYLGATQINIPSFDELLKKSCDISFNFSVFNQTDLSLTVLRLAELKKQGIKAEAIAVEVPQVLNIFTVYFGFILDQKLFNILRNNSLASFIVVESLSLDQDFVLGCGSLRDWKEFITYAMQSGTPVEVNRLGIKLYEILKVMRLGFIFTGYTENHHTALLTLKK